MQTIRPNRSPIQYPMTGSNPHSYYPTESQYDPRGYMPEQMNMQPNYHPNYQQYYNERGNSQYPAYYGSPRGIDPQSVQYMNPGYQYNQQMGNRDNRHHSRI